MSTLILKHPAVGRVLAIFVLGGGLMGGRLPAQNAIEPTAAAAPLPAGILPGSPVAQVLKLTQAGVDESIIQTYITNSTSTFNLDSDKIIYLKDAGVPNDLVLAMLVRDTAVQAQIAAANPPPPAPGTPTPPPLVPDNPPATPEPADTQPPQPPQPPDSSAPPATDVSISGFYNDLSPYGSWVIVEGYGNCWLPGVAVYNHDWQPYGDHGHWVSTDAGWYWVSDYSWGWAPFHYGRWFHDRRLGWCWQPATVWAPSWVTWRYADDYCGWAPLPPGAYYQDGVGWVYNGAVVGVDFDFGLAADSFIFVATADFCDPHPFRHRLDYARAIGVYHRTAVVNGFSRDRHGFMNHGIDPARLSRVTHTAIPTIPLTATRGAAGRVPSSEFAARNYGAASANHSAYTSAQNYRAAATPEPVQNRELQPYDQQVQRRVIAPLQNRSYAPAPMARPNAPAEVYRPATPAPEFHPAPFQEPARTMMPASEPRGGAPVYSTERTERIAPAPAPQPAPARSSSSSSSSSSSASRSGGNSNQKNVPH